MSEFYSLKRSDLPTELRLIISCLRIKPTEKEVQRIEKLSGAKIGWSDVLRWVDRHRVAPLVYQNLRRYGGNGVPSFVISALRSRFESNAHRSLVNAVELVRLYKLFHENGIEVLPLKGSVLALQVYGNLALRHAGDIDLLVAPSQVELADRILQVNYRRIMPGFRLTPAQRQRLLRLEKHFVYIHDQGNLRLELHWRPIAHQSIQIMDFTWLHRRTSAVTIAGSHLPALSLPDNLIYLSGHGGVHSWYRLFWLVDLAEIMRRHPEIDWPDVTALAAEANFLRQLVSGVILAHRLLDVPLPEVIQTYAEHNGIVAFLADLASHCMLCPDPSNFPLALQFHRYLWKFRFANSFSERLNYLQHILSQEDWQTDRFPESLYFLYYLLRIPILLQRRLGRSSNQTV